MNVYQINYPEEFIKELPVNFDYFKNKDLSNISEKFHCIFTTDWNWGRYSSMDRTQRMLIHQIYLEYLHSLFTEFKEVKEEKVIQGFID